MFLGSLRGTGDIAGNKISQDLISNSLLYMQNKTRFIMCQGMTSVLKVGPGSGGAGDRVTVSRRLVRRGLSGQRPCDVRGGGLGPREQQVKSKRNSHQNVLPHTIQVQHFSPC